MTVASGQAYLWPEPYPDLSPGDCRHVSDARRGAGPSPVAATIRRIVPSPTRNPIPSSSPWIRR